MIRVCPNCGAENDLTSVHCRNCSVKLPEPAAGMMRPPAALRRRAFLRAAGWLLILLVLGAAGFWARANIDWQDVRSGASGFCHTYQHVQSDVSGALHRWYFKWLSAEPPPPPPAPAPPSENVVKIRCPLCGGLGFTIKVDRPPKVAETKHSTSISRSEDTPETKKSACVLCNQNGGRTIILPAGAEVCSACHGMGKIIGVVHGNEMSSICKMCAGKGYIIRKY